MPSKQQTQSSNNYLYRILVYGAKPFYYRSGVRFLLGFPDCQEGNLAFSPTLPIGFRYLPAGGNFNTPAGEPHKGSAFSLWDKQNPEPGEVDAGTYRTPGITAAGETRETRGMNRVGLSARQDCSMKEEIQQSDTEPGSDRETVPAPIEMVEQVEQAAPTAETTETAETVETTRKKENIEIPGFSQKSIVFPSLARKRNNSILSPEETEKLVPPQRKPAKAKIGEERVAVTRLQGNTEKLIPLPGEPQKTKIDEEKMISEKTGRNPSPNPVVNLVSTVLTPLPRGMAKTSVHEVETANEEVKNVPGKQVIKKNGGNQHACSQTQLLPPPRKPGKAKIAEEKVISEKTGRNPSPNPAANLISPVLTPLPGGMGKTSLHDVETENGEGENVPGKQVISKDGGNQHACSQTQLSPPPRKPGKAKIAEKKMISEKTGRHPSPNPAANLISTVLTPLPGGMEKTSVHDIETANDEVKNVPGKPSTVASPLQKPGKVKIVDKKVISGKPVPRDEIVGRSLRESAVRIQQLRQEVQRLKAKAPTPNPVVDREMKEEEPPQTSNSAAQVGVISSQPTQPPGPDRVPWVFWEMSYMNRLHLRTL